MEKKELIFLLLILALATFFRFWNLDSIPPGLYPDEAINGNEAITNPGKLFYPENNGREGLFINLISLSFEIFGISIWSLRLVSAVIGILTCLGIYLLVKELFNNKTIALLSSFFLAISFWHINFSRIGFRGILVPFVLVFGFYFLFYAFRTRRIWSFIISGLFFGLGFYTYISYRFIVLLLLLVLTNFWSIYKKENLQRQFLLYTSYFILFVFIVALPIGLYFLKNPGDFVGRATPISIFAANSPIKEFLKSLILHLGMFNFYGDLNWRHNFSGSPLLFWPIGILFLIGSVLLFKEIVRTRTNKNLILLAWFFIFLLPGVLTYEGIPHALRTIGVIPVVYILAAMGGYYLYNLLNKKVKNKKLFYLVCLLFLFFLTFSQFEKYFFDWGENPEVENAFSKDYVEIGNYLNSLPEERPKYVIVNVPGVPVPYPDGIPMPAQTVMFIERTEYGKAQSTYLLPEDLDEIKMEEEAVIVKMKYGK